MDKMDADIEKLVTAGVNAKEAGNSSDAEVFFRQALAYDKNCRVAKYELAVLLHVTGRAASATDLLRENLDAEVDERTIKQIAISCSVAGMHSRLLPYLNVLAATSDNINFVATILQFSDYLQCNDLHSVLAELTQLEKKAQYYDVDGLAGKIVSAVDQRIPFSFIRIGDGEGTHLARSVCDEATYSALYMSNRKVFRQIWFGGLKKGEEDFERLCWKLNDVIHSADIIGIPFESWVRHEYHIGSITGIVSLSNIIKQLNQSFTNFVPNRGFCWQNIHFALARSGFFDDLFKRLASVSVISGHQDLARGIRERFGVEVKRAIKVPSESAYKAQNSDEADARYHFPDIFEEILLTLKTTSPGEVFIVAAGFLGKFYCQTIKAHGGIAIDVGSVADGWMGSITRPGMENVRPLV